MPPLGFLILQTSKYIFWMFDSIRGSMDSHMHFSITPNKNGTLQTPSSSLCALSPASARAPSSDDCAHKCKMAGGKGVT